MESDFELDWWGMVSLWLLMDVEKEPEAEEGTAKGGAGRCGSVRRRGMVDGFGQGGT